MAMACPQADYLVVDRNGTRSGCSTTGLANGAQPRQHAVQEERSERMLIVGPPLVTRGRTPTLYRALCRADRGSQAPGLVEARRGVGVDAGGRIEHSPPRASVMSVHPGCSVGVAGEEPSDPRGDA